MKRSNDFENNYGKKLKLDQDLDDLWGDDPDVDDIDDCILRATQVCEKEEIVQQNISVAPSYSTFKFNSPISSTQGAFNESFGFAGENTVAQDNNAGLEQKFQKLQMCLEAKEGEVSILRTQLKKTTERLEGEIATKQKELSEKLNVTEKEKEEAVTKLDLKNLEMANLKRKLLDVQKNAAKDIQSIQSSSKSTVLNTTVVNNVKECCNNELEPIKIPSNPLQHTTISLIFKQSTEDQLEIADIYRNESRRLESVMCKENTEVTKNFIAHSGAKIDEIFPEISILLNCDKNELELRDDCTGKLAVVSLQLLDEIWIYLKELDLKVKEDYIRRWDLEYLNNIEQILMTKTIFFDPLPWCPEECGIRCRQLLALLAELLPYNTYLSNYVMGKSTLYKHQDIIVHANFLDDYEADKGFVILNRIIEIIKKIGQMRKASKFCGFLSAVCHLACKILNSGLKLSSELYDDLHNIIREVIFSRPNPLVFNYVSLLLKQASIHKPFVEKLCRLPEHNSLIKKTKKGIFLINKDCCTFQVFSILFKGSIFCKNVRLDIAHNISVLKFIYNAFEFEEKWLYCHENQHDDCLYELCCLSLEVISTILKQCNQNQNVKDALELSIRVLRLVSSKCNDLPERKVNVDGHFKNVLMKLSGKSSEYDFGTLEEMKKTSTEENQYDNLNFNIPLLDDM